MLETEDGGYDIPVDLECISRLLCRDPASLYATHTWIYNCTFINTSLKFGSVFSMALCSSVVKDTQKSAS